MPLANIPVGAVYKPRAARKIASSRSGVSSPAALQVELSEVHHPRGPSESPPALAACSELNGRAYPHIHTMAYYSSTYVLLVCSAVLMSREAKIGGGAWK